MRGDADSWPRPPRPGVELVFTTFAGWLVMVSIPIGLGGISFSWDALNHHVYLGWIAEELRFDRDLLPASLQSYQYPYIYWPVYRLVASGIHGIWAGVLLQTLNSLLVPALWLIARACISDNSWYACGMRVAGVALALSGQVTLSLLDTTANDMPAAVPFVWSVALGLCATVPLRSRGWWTPERLVAASGLAAGIAVAFKLSNGPIGIPLVFLWLMAASGWQDRIRMAVRGAAAGSFGFLLAYGWWGWQMWVQFGNPVFPFYDFVFAPLRALAGWQP